MGGEEQVEWKRRGRGRDGALEGPPISSLVLALGPRRVNPALVEWDVKPYYTIPSAV